MALVAYATVGSNNLDAAKAFYDALLGAVGLNKLMDHPSGGRLYGKGRQLTFGVLGPYDGETASVGNGTMIAFNCETRAEVDLMHAKALELGAADEGAPGERSPGVYFAYFRDLDGNKLCAYRIGPA